MNIDVRRSKKLPSEVAALLTEEECMVERSLLELDEWWDSKADVLGRAGFKWWHEDRITKKFYEEIYPVRNLLNVICVDSIATCRFLMDNTPMVDAIVRFKNDGFVNIEVTQCKDGYIESVRKDHLREHGHVNAIGPVKIEGTNNKGKKISFSDIAILHNDVVTESQYQVLDKFRKKRDREYQQNTWVVLVYQEDVLFDEDDRLKMSAFYQEKIAPHNKETVKFFLLSSNGKFCCWDESL